MDSLVSIIIPVYNVQNYLPACVESLLHQSYYALEIILVDDGSTDDSGRICDPYAARDSRIHVVHQVNSGAANAKNTGLDIAHGSYIAFMDSDDWAEDTWIETMLSAAVSNDADVVECNFLMEYITYSKLGNDPAAFVNMCFNAEDYLSEYITRWTDALFWNKLFKADRISNIRFHSERRCVDDEFFTYKAITGANKILRIDAGLYHYRQRASSVTQVKEAQYQRTIDDIDILEERHRWIKQYYPRLAIDYLRHDIDTLLFFSKEYPFNNDAILHFRQSAKYYFSEALKKFPGKISMYYAFKIRTLPRKKIGAEFLHNSSVESIKNYYL